MALRISSLSTEYVRVPVTATKNGLPYDPTSSTVQMAFPGYGVEPITGDWKSASWETQGGNYWARCLIGPSGGTITLADGFYDVWVKIADSPETPVRRAGTLTIT